MPVLAHRATNGGDAARGGSSSTLSHVASSRSLSELSEADTDADALVRRHVPRAALVARGPAELAFRLPKEDTPRHAALTLQMNTP